ncbi:MAG TPA: aminotransferase class III-fold pyridoxal phosphate-dependent enzyme [Bdellovibrionota bacterium]|nr:aminotransferase class III-fold pyridoxal phosphate-dependent enzyme [Bdellovibrionota bacterium]
MSDTLRYPQTKLLLRDLNYDYPVIERSAGSFLYDRDGKDYIDASGGAFVTSVGHSNREVLTDMQRHQASVAYVNGMHFLSASSIELAEKILSEAPAGFGRVTFLNSGSEAVEAAIKLCQQIRVERGQSKKYKVVARDPGYHGNTLFALSASARPLYRKYFGPLLAEIPMCEAPYEYRSATGSWDAKAAEYYFKNFVEVVEKEGVETVSTFILETISGSSLGGTPPPPGYLKLVQDYCRAHDILLIADEVACGAGRTGKYFASAHFDFSPDVIVMGKAVNGGYAPLSCVVVKQNLVDEIFKGSGSYVHAQTYIQSPICAAAGLAVYDHIKKHQLVKNVERQGERLLTKLRELAQRSEHVGFVTGRGLFAGVELVEDKKTKKPFDRKNKVAENMHRKGMQNGIVLWPHKGQVDGERGDLVMIAPPFNVSDAEVDMIVNRLEKTIQEIG